MSMVVHPSIRKLFHPSRFKQFRRPWDRVKVAQLPVEYQKFYTEWMESEEKATPIHWIPKEGKWERNPETGVVNPVQNEPIHVNYPAEMHKGLWGGEGVIQGTVKKGKWRSPVPRYWTPRIRRTVVYSEILDVHLSVIVTERALELIDDYHGLDNYLMMTPAYDLKSLLALKLKRQIMFALMEKNFCRDDPQRQKELLEKYKEYMIPKNELEWYGLNLDEAIEKDRQIKEENARPVPLKTQMRAQLFEELKNARDNPPEAQNVDSTQASTSKGWMSKINPFASSQ